MLVIAWLLPPLEEQLFIQCHAYNMAVTRTESRLKESGCSNTRQKLQTNKGSRIYLACFSSLEGKIHTHKMLTIIGMHKANYTETLQYQPFDSQMRTDYFGQELSN